MDSNTDELYRALVEERISQNEDATLVTLLGAVKRKRRNRAIFRTGSALALVLVIALFGMLSFGPNAEVEPEPFATIENETHWSVIETEIAYTLLSSNADQNWESIETNFSIQANIIDEDTLLTHFAGRPIMLAESGDSGPKRLLLIDEFE